MRKMNDTQIMLIEIVIGLLIMVLLLTVVIGIIEIFKK